MSYKPKFSAKSLKFQPMPMATLMENLKTLNTQLGNDDDDENNGGYPDSSGSIPKTPVSEKSQTLRSERSAGSFQADKRRVPFSKSSVKVANKENNDKTSLSDKKQDPRSRSGLSSHEKKKNFAKVTPKKVFTSRVRRKLSLVPNQERLPGPSCSSYNSQQSHTKQDSPPHPLRMKKNKLQFKTMIIKEHKFMIIKKLGMGGSSEVYKVMALNSNEDYAVKCVDLATDRETARGYLNEVRILRELQHSDRVVKLYDYEHDRRNKCLRLLLELGETDLSSFMRRTPPSPALVIHFWEEMLRAVQQIHKYGIVHADLKPANFLLVSGRLKLIDFGIASAVSSEATSVERSTMKGTFSYISPEALGGDGLKPIKVSFYSDVWSLGCILYSMVYGRTPFAHLPTIAKLETIRDPAHVIEYPPANQYPCTLLRSMTQCLKYQGHARPTVDDLLRVNHLTITETLPVAPLYKITPHVTKEEFELITGSSVTLKDKSQLVA